MKRNNNSLTSNNPVIITKKMVEEWYSADLISQTARNAALDILFPRAWGLWVARLLSNLGAALILSGIIYFFAFNWAKITKFQKFTLLECFIGLSTLLASYFTLKRWYGQIMLICASVGVGAFLAVFGQIYQTGADSYQLFLLWMLLISGWTLISNSAVQWLLWLTVANLFLMQYWFQEVMTIDWDLYFLYTCLALLNGLILALREYGNYRGLAWLNMHWLRNILLIPVLICLIIPIEMWAKWSMVYSPLLIISLSISILGQLAVFYTYRYLLPDIKALSLSMLALCITFIELINKGLALERWNDFLGIAYFLKTIIISSVFGLAIWWVYKIRQKSEFKDEE